MNDQSPNTAADGPATGGLAATNTNTNTNAATAPASGDGRRTYEQSGCYPAEGKQFRLWALLGWLSLVIIGLAVAAAVLNIYFLGAPWKAG